MIDKIRNLVKHLRTQIKEANRTGSEWVYILKIEAEKCLELAEAEDTILKSPVKAEMKGGGSTWWYVCGECHTAIDNIDHFCRQCGRKIDWT